MDMDGVEYSLPQCSAPFLIERLQEIGPAVAGAMGSGPIGWCDIAAWQECNCVVMPPWQARMLIDLSREYVGFSVKAQAEDCPAPWSDEAATESRREAVDRGLRLGFKALMERPRKG